MLSHRKPAGAGCTSSEARRLFPTLILLTGLPGLIAFIAVLRPPMLSLPAAQAQIVPAWQFRWESLSQDEPCPTAAEGYCDASLARRRLCIGPLEVRYSYSH